MGPCNDDESHNCTFKNCKTLSANNLCGHLPDSLGKIENLSDLVLMENPWHNSGFEGAGFVRLFLPVNLENRNYFTRYMKKHIKEPRDLLFSRVCKDMFTFPSYVVVICGCSNWIKQCLDIWDSVPNCQFWDIQWASVIARCIKSCKSIDWEGFLPALFTRFLNMFEVREEVFLKTV